ncbi:hypothetical protein ACJIZ3_007769 [Penstemon smallii]|uniref:Eukaryotic translation initiation factor 4G n=1 Tax=Penstemon smallii TaxID=265156 RepID=A0ABD3T8V4_9LAMI
MSYNQSRSDRSDSTQQRKAGRSGSSNQQRYFTGGATTKGGGGALSAPTNPSNRSFNKKYNSGTQGGQSSARSQDVSSDSSNSYVAHAVQNGQLQQQPTHGASVAPVTTTSSSVKLMDTPAQKPTRAVPKGPKPPSSIAAQPSNVSTATSESKPPTTPPKAPEDASRSFSLQFGSISPGFVNGMQIPPRTSSAPPNLDEQKKAQARHESLRAAPALPIPSAAKHYLPKKDTGILEPPNAGEAQSLSKSKRDTQVSGAPPVMQTQKSSVHPIPGMHMQLPFHQMQVPVKFGGPNPQIQSGTSIPMPMPIPLPIGNPPVQQPMFVSGLQPHPMQAQGMMHQGPSLNFSSQMGPQLPPQLGNMGMSISPQFSQHQGGKYSGSRKTVKITHPDTHEELRLDGSPGPRSHPSAPPPSHPIPSYPPNHPMNFYPNFFPTASSVPLSSTQVPPTSQAPRLYSQVTVKAVSGSHAEKEPLPPTSSYSVGKTDSLKPSKLHGQDSVLPQKVIEPSLGNSLPQTKPGLGTPSTSAATSDPVKVENDELNTLSLTPAPMDSSALTSTNTNEEARNVVVVPDSIKDNTTKLVHMQDEVNRKSTSLSSLPSQLQETEAVEEKSTPSRTNLVNETAKGLLSTTVAVASEAPKGDTKKDTGDASESLGTKSVNSGQSISDTMGKKEQGEAILSEVSDPANEYPDQKVTSTTAGCLLENTQSRSEELSRCYSDDDKMADGLGAFTHPTGVENNESSVSAVSEITSTKSTVVEKESAPVLVKYPPEGPLKSENGDIDKISGGLVPPTLKDSILSDTNVAKSVVQRPKKKKKELYRKAEAAGTSSDLYNAYKGPEEKKESANSAEETECASAVRTKQTSAQDNALPSEKPAQSKMEPDDWEDAAEISTSHLETSKNGNQGIDGDMNGLMTKRYSRDFLLKFVEQCTDLPEGFEISTDIAGALLVSSVNVPRESYPGRDIDRPNVGSSRPDRRGIGLGDVDKWNKVPGPLMGGRGDIRTDVGYADNVVGFRPGQGGNHGVSRNPRAQTPVQFTGGILSGPMQTYGPQGGLQRNNSDSDRWQRATGFQKGLMPSPHGPQQVMHKAEKKYEVGKVTDEEQAKQRQLKGILNKLTPQNFEKLFQQVKQVNIDNVVTLSGVISQIFDKALMEPTFCEMYANFCFHLAADLPDLSVDNEKITFKRLLLNKCQEEFERGEREEEEANKEEVEGENKQTAEEREEKRLRVRRRMLGNIRLIGELYKKRMLTERIMHECINKLLGQYQNPDEENIEALCKLMSTIGEMIDHPKAKEFMDAYFDIMAQLSLNMKLSSRVRFMLKDSIDLRKNKWQQRRKVEGPKKIEEVHRDAAQERQAQSSRLGRAPSMGSSIRRALPMDYTSRATNILSSPSSQFGGFRAAPPQNRGYGSQDARMEERHSFDNRTMSIPLPQRPFGDDSITLGPQGGLARGMAFRGQPSVPSIPFEMPSPGDARRMGPNLNGFGSIPEQALYGQREDLMPRYVPDRSSVPSIYEHSHPQDQSITQGIRDVRSADRNFDRSLTAPARGGPPTSMQNASTDLSEERLRDKSMAAIKEYYSARDVNEVALCIKDLNTPNFHPSMISLWVTDSFERKDVERSLLTKLLINLTKLRDGLISEDQLIKGFESVLAVLEDALSDAPRAAEFLGRIFANVILENVISLSEIGRLIYEGGEDQGQLVESGIAAEVLGFILDTIKSEKGDSVLNGIRLSSDLRLENFKPPGSSNKTWRIDKFI